MFPLVPLGSIAHPVSRPIPVLPGQPYRTIGVKWWGEGAYERETIDGSQTAAKTLSLVREGDLIINKIWVRHGSTAIAGNDVDGCAASGEFPTFELDHELVHPRWLHWQTKSPAFWAKCDALSQGTSGKNRIRPELFLTIQVPLPPLAEQCRIIARIEEIAEKVALAQGLRSEIDADTDPFREALIASIIPQKLKLYTKVGFGKLILRSRHQAHIEATKLYNGLGTRMWGMGVYVHEQRRGDDFRAERYIASEGQLVYNEVWAHNGAIGIIPVGLSDAVVSRHFHVFDVDWSLLLPDYLGWIFRSPWFWQQCQDGSVGTSGRGHMRREHLERIELPVPPIPEQHLIVAELDALQAKIDALKAMQTETAAELDALLPAVLDRAFKGEL